MARLNSSSSGKREGERGGEVMHRVTEVSLESPLAWLCRFERYWLIVVLFGLCMLWATIITTSKTKKQLAKSPS